MLGTIAATVSGKGMISCTFTNVHTHLALSKGRQAQGARLHCWECVYASGGVTHLRMSNTGVCCYRPCAIGHPALGSLTASMASECEPFSFLLCVFSQVPGDVYATAGSHPLVLPDLPLWKGHVQL